MSDDTETLAPQSDGIAIQGEAAPAPVVDVESRARAHGWVGKDEWQGDPDKWRPADEFVKRGEELLPVALERSRALERRLADIEAQAARERATYTDHLSRVEKTALTALERQKAILESSYKAALRQAAETGDVARYDQLEKDRVVALQPYDQAPPVQQPAPPPQQAHADPTVASWVQKNEWFNRDPVLNSVAQAIHMDLLRSRPGMSLEENLQATTQEVRRRFPDKFGTPSTPTTIVAPMVEAGGGRMPSTTARRGKGAQDLPSDVRATGERFVKQGLFKDLNEYAAEFFADN